ncbi:MAG: AraC family transcriptional regulator [Lachnospiraceae bacterium]
MNKDLIPTQAMNINLLYITQACYEVNWKSVPHTHHFTELFYVVSGEGIMVIEEKQFSLRQDDLIIINPNVSHVEFGDGIHQLEYIVLGIDGLQFQAPNSAVLYNYSLHNLHSSRDELMGYFIKMLTEVRCQNDNYERICRNLLECLILFFTRQTKDVLSFATVKKTLRECRYIEQYIEEHFSDDITLETLSAITHMNKYYLVHTFRDYKGISPINYLIERRIQEAAYLLETSDYSIGRIAHAVGFSSQSYFSQVFRKEKGLSPKKYRNTFDS